MSKEQGSIIPIFDKWCKDNNYEGDIPSFSGGYDMKKAEDCSEFSKWLDDFIGHSSELLPYLRKKLKEKQ